MLTINSALSRGLDRYIIDRRGSWTHDAQSCADGAVKLANDDDEVAFVGPLTLNLAVLAENQMQPLSGGDCACQSSELMSYDVEIPAGHTWRYSMRELNLLRGGANRGCSVIIRPNRPRFVPPTQATTDLPCDYAVEPISDSGVFFPAACEPCGSRPVRLPPPDCGPRLDVPPASGGCIRPRFFTGMSITREDMETELRYLRLKLRLHNRAAGAGVVWGLDVALRGTAVVVGPGYGVDSCGNDLTVACDYAVSAAALLSDPAICRQLQHRGDGCFALLLQYAECPEAPRPVHGDGCVPAAVACEMSRVRETVRLRLVPPRELPATPLGVLLAKIKALSGASALLGVMTGIKDTGSAVTPVVGGGSWQPAPAGTVVPWRFRITNPITPAGVLMTPPSAPPDLVATMSASKAGDPVQVAVEVQGSTLSASSITAGGVTKPLGVAGGVITAPAPATAAATASVTWEADAGGTRLRGTSLLDLQSIAAPPVTGTIRDISTNGIYVDFHGATPAAGQPVTLTSPDGTSVTSQVVGPSGSNHIVAMVPGANVGRTWTVSYGGSVQVRMTARATAVERFVPGGGQPAPCCGASCCGGEARDAQAELRLLVAALIYGKLLQTLAARRTQDDGEAVVVARVKQLLAAALAASKASLGTLLELESLLHELYRTWCAAAIYDGPRAAGDPDGVVIGCAHIRAGAICSVDPLGGRRWVIHQPLLDHWAAQFGLDPLDRTVGQLFARLCCLSHLPGLAAIAQLPTNGNIPVPATDATGINLGAASPAMATSLAGGGWSSLVGGNQDYASATGTAALSSVSVSGAGGLLQSLLLLPLLDLTGIALLVEQLFCATKATDKGTTDGIPQTGASANNRRVVGVVGQIMSRETDARRAPARLRSTASGVTRAVLAAVPVSAVVKAEAPITAALAKAGIDDVATFLAHEPEALHTEALHGEHGPALDDAALKAEDAVATVATAVNETLIQFAKRDLRSARDLDRIEVAEKFSKDLSARLDKAGLKLDPKAVGAAVLAFKAG